MAPRKAAAAAKPARVTRARAAEEEPEVALEEAPKRRATKKEAVPTTTRTKALESKSKVTKKADAVAAAKTTKSKARSTKATQVTEPAEQEEEQQEDEDLEQAAPPTTSTRSKPTRAENAATTLTAAPRRRIRVTPLDAPAVEVAPEEAKPTTKKATSKTKKGPESTSKPASTRAKKGASAVEMEEEREAAPEVEMRDVTAPKKRGTRSKAASVEEEQSTTEATEEPAVPKTRGRPKKTAKESVSAVSQVEEEPVHVQPATRQTRARAGSNASNAVEVPPKPTTDKRKKVTFQDLPDEEEGKENIPVTKSRATKKSTTSTKKSEPATKGIRAKPVRKTAASTARSTRGAASKAATVPVEDQEVEEPTKIASRALTPKKITQVAKAIPEDSDEEDELSGAKTPVRDLSLSPRRQHLSPSRKMSPVRKLDFTPALSAKAMPTEKADGVPAGSIMSPPRRLPASPLKEVYDQSPRRAPEGITIFRAQLPDAPAAAFAPRSPSKDSLLHQSPKRGLLDRAMFAASAQKHRSPLKTSLHLSPAKRLFSPLKQSMTRISPLPKKKDSSPLRSILSQQKSPGDTALEVTSHFRSSISPQRSARVYRMSDDELAMEQASDVDFDTSVLNVRSPLKVNKVKPVVADPFIEDEDEDEDEEQDQQMDDQPVPALDSAAAETSNQLNDCDTEDDDETIPDDETVSDIDRSEDEADSSRLAVSESMGMVAPTDVERTSRLSNSQFNRPRNMDDESEDELAADQTPTSRFVMPPPQSFGGLNFQPRQSTGIAPPSASRNIGFTPLADQMTGWRAGSPIKKSPAARLREASPTAFSPLASAHVEGSVVLSRQGTPVQSATKRRSLAASRMSLVPSAAGSPAKSNFFAEGMAAQEFETEAEQNDVDTEEEDLHDVLEPESVPDVEENGSDASSDTESVSDHEPGELTTDLIKFTNASDTAMVDFEALAQEANELASHDDEMDEQDESSHEVSDMETTEQHEVSILDPAGIAEEDNVLNATSPAVSPQQTPRSLRSDHVGGKCVDESVIAEDGVVVEATSPDATPMEVSVEHATVQVDDEIFDQDSIVEGDNVLNATSPAAAPMGDSLQHATIQVDDQIFDQDAIVEDDYVLNATSPVAPLGDSESVAHAAEAEDSIEPSSPAHGPASPLKVHGTIEAMDFNVTPIRADVTLPRFVNTVVSKVPLRPEGIISPLKVHKKRARSMSASASLIAKRRISEGLEELVPRLMEEEVISKEALQVLYSSPQRRVRSAAPSPAHSLASGLTTPGQMSFAIDDFGDSTLDGIELPDDEMDLDDDLSEDEITEKMHVDESMMTIGSTFFKTPKASARRPARTPASVRSVSAVTPGYAADSQPSARREKVSTAATPSANSSKTPATASKFKTPATAAKANQPTTERKATAPAQTPVPSRTPLQAVANGPLAGAVVFVDVHTTEGADASGIYVELLTNMGARCVKDWRWNPRASMPANVAEGTVAGNPGITHVIFKDGGKRTLEKVRAAKGQVACVGAAWVLDCEREGKWVDETAYAVDSSILPRGGSRRRKSMEPRALVNQNGSLSAVKDRRSRGGDRRSVSAEYNGLTDAMRMDLVNTPIRGRESLEDEDHDDDETEISSTYNSPTAATVGETMDVGRLVSLEDDDESMLPTGVTPFTARAKHLADTPDATLSVDYDPSTPALVSKGRQLLQMSAPPKQINKGVFEDEDESGKENASEKFKVRIGGKKFDGRRKTLGVGLGFKPVVGSPLRKDL